MWFLSQPGDDARRQLLSHCLHTATLIFDCNESNRGIADPNQESLWSEIGVSR